MMIPVLICMTREQWVYGYTHETPEHGMSVTIYDARLLDGIMWGDIFCIATTGAPASGGYLYLSKAAPEYTLAKWAEWLPVTEEAAVRLDSWK